MMETIETGLVRIPIKKLVISPLNVRKKQGTGIEELAALIASQGLIHNLVVTVQQKKGRKSGKYEVIAGGRRLAALNLLVADRRLSKDHEVDCRVVEHKEALEISLSENSGREHMHPADLVMAYRSLIDAGFALDEIAPRFGVSPLTVRRYLKLTKVSPRIFALYAEDRMSFEQITALALTDDHELQERLWDNTPEYQRNGATFRRLITETEINIRTSPLARFVGVEEYEAAGGVIRRDLFGEEDDGYMQDAELLESLALEKLNQAVEPLKEKGYAWVQVRTTFDYSDRAEFSQMRIVRREPTSAEQARMDALEAELEAIEAGYDGSDEERGSTGELYKSIEKKKKAERIRDELTKLAESLEEIYPDDLAIAGAIATVDHEGKLRIERGLIRKEDMRKQPKESKESKEPRESREQNEPGESGEREAAAIEGAGGEKPVHSEKLTRMLTVHRTAAVQAAMTNRPEVALAALVHRMAVQIFSNDSASNPVLQISIEETRVKPDAEGIEQSKAATALAKKRRQWQKRIDAAGRGGMTLFGWLLEQSQQDLLDLLAFCTAVSVNTVSERESTPPQDVTALMTALNLDMADWWEATGESYLSHVSKDRLLAIVAQAVSPEHARSMNGLKKGDLVRQAEQVLSGIKWLPDHFKVTKTRTGKQSDA
ncbi:ParB/RepB/Spo0J family partition protein [Nitrosospira multiformis]|uniref:ParB-like nuclease n=2 Tax=Nitrosospira multiformis (strain ATCC 25196 / NCIMB 11849 / C 71) TaxID=323848 RepID=Q2Y667_NITMU|nr:ParB/RepB/Spo0J family partition protein [Nitrosospira multiformis]ABB75754.1 ParB-like nuclease [Nitrosospira multiformis ATCC 25196]